MPGKQQNNIQHFCKYSYLHIASNSMAVFESNYDTTSDTSKICNKPNLFAVKLFGFRLQYFLAYLFLCKNRRNFKRQEIIPTGKTVLRITTKAGLMLL